MIDKINIPLARLTKNKIEKCKLLKSGMKIEILLLTLLNKRIIIEYNEQFYAMEKMGKFLEIYKLSKWTKIEM